MLVSLGTRLCVQWLIAFLVVAIPWAVAGQEPEPDDKTIRDTGGQPIPHALSRLGTTHWRPCCGT